MDYLRAHWVFKFFLYLAVSFLFLPGCSIGYQKDGNAVYYKYWNEGSGSHKNKLDADPVTFEVLKHDSYAKDKQKVFYKGDIIKGADATTFETLDEWYASDKNKGYYGRDSIISSKGRTFQVIDDYYSTDGVNVFYDTLPLNVCSAKAFRFVFGDTNEYARWATDGCFYYYMNYKVPSDDYGNMQVYKKGGGLSKDKNYVYFLDHKLNYDVDGKKVVDTIDAASFTVIGFLECRDKWGCFNPYHGRENCSEE
jgi:hypothetical protein